MNLRVTQQTVIQTALADSQRLTAQLATLQSQAATGKRLNAVSDDPTTSMAILASATQAQVLDAHLENVQTATTVLDTSVATLQQVSTIFTQAKSIAIEAGNSGNDTAAFNALAQQVDGLIGRLFDAANTQQNHTYLFGGTAGKTQPFVITRTDSDGRPAAVEYQASPDADAAIVNTHLQLAIYYPGSDIFSARQRQAPVYRGNTGAQSGGGTDSAIGETDLLVQHTVTTFAPGSGVQAGTSSATGDTILGPLGRHRLHITDTSGTGAAGNVSLDGGPPVAFTSSDTNLAVFNANGDVVYLDTTAIGANFDGNVDIAADGTLSIDGGATTSPIAFQPGQVVTDSQNGHAIFVDTSAVDRAGTEIIDHPGTTDAFQSLIALRDLLRNVRQQPAHDQITSISGQIGELERISKNVLTKLGQQSASLETLESLKSHLQNLKVDAQKNVHELGDADTADIVVKLQSFQQMLQLSLATFARIQGQSLLDFLK